MFLHLIFQTWAKMSSKYRLWWPGDLDCVSNSSRRLLKDPGSIPAQDYNIDLSILYLAIQIAGGWFMF